MRTSKSDLLSYLCYPSYNRECINSRLVELERAGVVGLVRLIDKGHSSVVLEVELRSGEHAALKILRTDSKREDLLTECEIVRKAYPISPKLIECGRSYVLMELIRGVPVIKILHKHEERLPLILKVLSAGRGLDVLEIDHRELSRAHKHVVLTYDDKVKIFDYESAAISEYPRNLCRLTSWIFNSVLEIKLRREAVELLRKYKKADRELRREIFSELVSHTVSTLERHR